MKDLQYRAEFTSAELLQKQRAKVKALMPARIVRVIPDWKALGTLQGTQLTLECPHCKNVEGYLMSELSLQLEAVFYPDVKSCTNDYDISSYACINCEKEYRITTKNVLRALLESELFED